MRFYVLTILAFGAAVSMATTCRAALVMGSISFDAIADQQVRIPPGTPLTGAPFNIPGGAEFDLSAFGVVSLGWDADSDSDGSTSLSTFSANFTEVHPNLGPYSLAATGVGPGATFTGSLDNIVEIGGDLVSADWTLNTTFSLTFTAAPGQPVIYTQQLATFTGVIRGGDATIGEVFTSAGEIEGFLSAGNPASDPLAAISFNRTVTAVPEPSSFAMLSLSGLSLLCRRRRSTS